MAVGTIILLSLAAYYAIGLGSAVYFYWPYLDITPTTSSDIEMASFSSKPSPSV